MATPMVAPGILCGLQLTTEDAKVVRCAVPETIEGVEADRCGLPPTIAGTSGVHCWLHTLRLRRLRSPHNSRPQPTAVGLGTGRQRL